MTSLAPADLCYLNHCLPVLVHIPFTKSNFGGTGGFPACSILFPHPYFHVLSQVGLKLGISLPLPLAYLELRIYAFTCGKYP